MKRTGFCKNNYCEGSKINIPVDSISFNRGYAAFDFMKVINGKPFYTERHLNRFIHTMSILRIEIPYSKNDLSEIIKTIINKNTTSDYGLKLFATPIAAKNQDTFHADLFIVPVDLPQYPEEGFITGFKLITKEYARFLPEAKSTNYLPSIFWENELKKYEALEILYCYNKQVFETSKSNIFIVKNKQVFTPSKNVLKGITRSIVIDILNKQQISFSEKEISTNELFAADEVFITSTTKRIAPIVEIDKKTIGNGKVGEITTLLKQEYASLL